MSAPGVNGYCYGWVAGALTGAAYTVVCQPLESMRAQLVTGAKKVRPTFQGSGPYFVRNILIVAFTQLFYEKLAGRPLGTRDHA